MVATSQFSGAYGGVVSFAIEGSHEDRLRFVNDLRLITSAVSLGHDETLIAYEHYTGDQAAALAEPFRDHGLIRLAIGLESSDDLIADLSRARRCLRLHLGLLGKHSAAHGSARSDIVRPSCRACKMSLHLVRLSLSRSWSDAGEAGEGPRDRRAG